MRALGIWGVYLISTGLGLSTAPALLVTAIFSLGATIMGPAVLTIEYEPVPRGFAALLLILAVGLIARGCYAAAGVAGGVAFLFHAPTCLPFYLVSVFWALWPGPNRRLRLRTLGPMMAAIVVLGIASRFQAGINEPQQFFARIGPRLEELQRMRGSYNWISIWWRQWLLHYVLLWIATVAACWRLRKDMTQDRRFFFGGMPLVAILSVPASYVLLEGMKWSLLPQVQPMRSLLFVTAFAMILGAVAGCRAVQRKRFFEGFLWFVLVYLVAANRTVEFPEAGRAALILGLSAFAVLALWLYESSRPGSAAAVALAAALPFFLIPSWGHLRNYPGFEHAELTAAAQWARSSTSKDAVFLFPDAAEDLRAGVFRTESLRAIYVDWKGGGQINFLAGFGDEWWSRWQRTMAGGFNPQHLERYRGLGIDYLVLERKNRLESPAPVYENARFVVYAVNTSGG
jgi:hypothetical protein